MSFLVHRLSQNYVVWWIIVVSLSFIIFLMFIWIMSFFLFCCKSTMCFSVHIFCMGISLICYFHFKNNASGCRFCYSLVFSSCCRFLILLFINYVLFFFVHPIFDGLSPSWILLFLCFFLMNFLVKIYIVVFHLIT